MLGLGDRRDHGVAVSSHLRVLDKDVRPASVVEHHLSSVGIYQVGNHAHATSILIAAEVLHRGTAHWDPPVEACRETVADPRDFA